MIDHHPLFEIPAILSDDPIADSEEIKVMSQCNDAFYRTIAPSIEKDLQGDDSSIVLLDEFFDEIEFCGVDPVNYIHFVSEQINDLCRGV